MKDYSKIDVMGKKCQDDMYKAFNEGYEQGYHDGRTTIKINDSDKLTKMCEESYHAGLDEAWEMADRIFKMSPEQRMKQLGQLCGYSPFENISIQDALKKIGLEADKHTGKGKWLEKCTVWGKNKSIDVFVCNKCEAEVSYPTNFCPNCGADMRD